MAPARIAWKRLTRSTDMRAVSSLKPVSQLVVLASAWSMFVPTIYGQSLAADPKPAAVKDDDEPKVVEPPKLPDPPDAIRMSPKDRVWVDKKKKQVYVDGAIALREGYLEMFACLVNTKEHESIVAARTKAQT